MKRSPARRNFWKKGTSLAAALSLAFSFPVLPAHAQTKSAPAALLLSEISELKIPEALGKIETVNGGKGKPVILIQDAHAVSEAQQNIADLIGHLHEHYGVSIVAFEGASSKVDARFFQSFPDRKVFEKVFRTYMEQSELTGVNAAALRPDREINFQGIEDWNLYEEGTRNFLLALEKESELIRVLEELEEKLLAEKKAAYSKELFALDELLGRFWKNEAGLGEILPALNRAAAPPESSSLEALSRNISKTLAGEDRRIEAEVRRLAERMEKELSETAARETRMTFNEKYQAFRTGRMDAKEFANYLHFLNPELKLSHETFSALKDIRRLREIQGTEFFHELEIYIEEAKEALFRKEDERRLDKKDKALRLARKLILLELTRNDLEVLRRLEAGESKEAEDIKPLLERARNQIRFYETAKARENVFFDRLKTLREEAGDSPAVFVAGGFHSRGMTERLTAAGIPWALVTPAISEMPETIPYREHMLGEVSWKNYFAVKNGKINLYEAFVRAARDRLIAEAGSRRGVTLKTWRDQILLDLAKEGRLEDAGEYTKFIDEAVKETGLTPGESEWKANAERFLGELRKLESAGRFNQQNVAFLLGKMTSAELIPSNILVPKAETRLYVPDLLETFDAGEIAGLFDDPKPAAAGEDPRSELRASEERAEELFQKALGLFAAKNLITEAESRELYEDPKGAIERLRTGEPEKLTAAISVSVKGSREQRTVTLELLLQNAVKRRESQSRAAAGPVEKPASITPAFEFPNLDFGPLAERSAYRTRSKTKRPSLFVWIAGGAAAIAVAALTALFFAQEEAEKPKAPERKARERVEQPLEKKLPEIPPPLPPLEPPLPKPIPAPEALPALDGPTAAHYQKEARAYNNYIKEETGLLRFVYTTGDGRMKSAYALIDHIAAGERMTYTQPLAMGTLVNALSQQVEGNLPQTVEDPLEEIDNLLDFFDAWDQKFGAPVSWIQFEKNEEGEYTALLNPRLQGEIRIGHSSEDYLGFLGNLLVADGALKAALDNPANAETAEKIAGVRAKILKTAAEMKSVFSAMVDPLSGNLWAGVHLEEGQAPVPVMARKVNRLSEDMEAIFLASAMGYIPESVLQDLQIRPIIYLGTKDSWTAASSVYGAAFQMPGYNGIINLRRLYKPLDDLYDGTEAAFIDLYGASNGTSYYPGSAFGTGGRYYSHAGHPKLSEVAGVKSDMIVPAFAAISGERSRRHLMQAFGHMNLLDPSTGVPYESFYVGEYHGERTLIAIPFHSAVAAPLAAIAYSHQFDSTNDIVDFIHDEAHHGIPDLRERIDGIVRHKFGLADGAFEMMITPPPAALETGEKAPERIVSEADLPAKIEDEKINVFTNLMPAPASIGIFTAAPSYPGNFAWLTRDNSSAIYYNLVEGENEISGAFWKTREIDPEKITAAEITLGSKADVPEKMGADITLEIKDAEGTIGKKVAIDRADITPDAKILVDLTPIAAAARGRGPVIEIALTFNGKDTKGHIIIKSLVLHQTELNPLDNAELGPRMDWREETLQTKPAPRSELRIGAGPRELRQWLGDLNGKTDLFAVLREFARNYEKLTAEEREALSGEMRLIMERQETVPNDLIRLARRNWPAVLIESLDVLSRGDLSVRALTFPEFLRMKAGLEKESPEIFEGVFLYAQTLLKINERLTGRIERGRLLIALALGGAILFGKLALEYGAGEALEQGIDRVRQAAAEKREAEKEKRLAEKEAIEREREALAAEISSLARRIADPAENLERAIEELQAAANEKQVLVLEMISKIYREPETSEKTIGRILDFYRSTLVDGASSGASLDLRIKVLLFLRKNGDPEIVSILSDALQKSLMLQDKSTEPEDAIFTEEIIINDLLLMLQSLGAEKAIARAISEANLPAESEGGKIDVVNNLMPLPPTVSFSTAPSYPGNFAWLTAGGIAVIHYDLVADENEALGVFWKTRKIDPEKIGRAEITLGRAINVPTEGNADITLEFKDARGTIGKGIVIDRSLFKPDSKIQLDLAQVLSEAEDRGPVIEIALSFKGKDTKGTLVVESFVLHEREPGKSGEEPRVESKADGRPELRALSAEERVTVEFSMGVLQTFLAARESFDVASGKWTPVKDDAALIAEGPFELLMVLGSPDNRVPEEAARLAKLLRAGNPAMKILTSGKGGSAHGFELKPEDAGVPEAIRYKRTMERLGAAVDFTEEASTNSGMNIVKSRILLQEEKFYPKKVLIFQTPLSQKRSGATFIKQFPEQGETLESLGIEKMVSYAPYLRDLSSLTDEELITITKEALEEMTRAHTYPEDGFMVEVQIPEEVERAETFLRSLHQFFARSELRAETAEQVEAALNERQLLFQEEQFRKSKENLRGQFRGLRESEIEELARKTAMKINIDAHEVVELLTNLAGEEALVASYNNDAESFFLLALNFSWSLAAGGRKRIQDFFFIQDAVDIAEFRRVLAADASAVSDLLTAAALGEPISNIRTEFPALIRENTAGEIPLEEMMRRLSDDIQRSLPGAFALLRENEGLQKWRTHIRENLTSEEIEAVLTWFVKERSDGLEQLKHLRNDLERDPLNFLAALSLPLLRGWDLERVANMNFYRTPVERLPQLFWRMSLIDYLAEQGAPVQSELSFAEIQAYVPAFEDAYDEDGFPLGEARSELRMKLGVTVRSGNVILETRRIKEGYHIEARTVKPVNIADAWEVQRHAYGLYNAIADYAEALSDEQGEVSPQEIKVKDEVFEKIASLPAYQADIKAVMGERASSGYVDQLDLYRVLGRMRGKRLIPELPVYPEIVKEPAYHVALLVDPQRSNVDSAILRGLLGNSNIAVDVIVGITAQELRTRLNSSVYGEFLSSRQIRFSEEEEWIEILGKRIKVVKSPSNLTVEAWSETGIDTFISTYDIADDYKERMAKAVFGSTRLDPARFVSMHDLDVFDYKESRQDYLGEPYRGKDAQIESSLVRVPVQLHEALRTNRAFTKVPYVLDLDYQISPMFSEAILDQSGKKRAASRNIIPANPNGQKYIRRALREEIQARTKRQDDVGTVRVTSAPVPVGDRIVFQIAMQGESAEQFLRNLGLRPEKIDWKSEEAEDRITEAFAAQVVDKLNAPFMLKFNRQLVNTDARFEEDILVDREGLTAVLEQPNGQRGIRLSVPIVFNRELQDVRSFVDILTEMNRRRNLPPRGTEADPRLSAFGKRIKLALEDGTLPPAPLEIPAKLGELLEKPVTVGILGSQGQIGSRLGTIGFESLNFSLAAGSGPSVEAQVDSAQMSSITGPIRSNGREVPVRSEIYAKPKNGLIGEVTFGDGHPFYLMERYRDLTQIPWAEQGVEVVVDATGAFVKPEQLVGHLNAGRATKNGAEAVLLTAPFKGGDGVYPTIVFGVNHGQILRFMEAGEAPYIFSNASCTTNCIAHMTQYVNRLPSAFTKHLREKYGVAVTVSPPVLSPSGAVHAPTNSNPLIDLGEDKSAMSTFFYSSGVTKAIKQLNLENDPWPKAFTGFAFRVGGASTSIAHLPIIFQIKELSGEDRARLAEKAKEISPELIAIARQVAEEMSREEAYRGLIRSVTDEEGFTSEIAAGTTDVVLDWQQAQANFRPDAGLMSLSLNGFYDNVEQYTAQLARTLDQIARDLRRVQAKKETEIRLSEYRDRYEMLIVQAAAYNQISQEETGLDDEGYRAYQALIIRLLRALEVPDEPEQAEGVIRAIHTTEALLLPFESVSPRVRKVREELKAAALELQAAARFEMRAAAITSRLDAVEIAYDEMFQILEREFPGLVEKTSSVPNKTIRQLIYFMRSQEQELDEPGRPFRILDLGGDGARTAYRLAAMGKRIQVTSAEANPFLAHLASFIRDGRSGYEFEVSLFSALREAGRQETGAQMREKIQMLFPVVEWLRRELLSAGILDKVTPVNRGPFVFSADYYTRFDAVFHNFPHREEIPARVFSRRLLQQVLPNLKPSAYLFLPRHPILEEIGFMPRLQAEARVEKISTDPLDRDLAVYRNAGRSDMHAETLAEAADYLEWLHTESPSFEALETLEQLARWFGGEDAVLRAFNDHPINPTLLHALVAALQELDPVLDFARLDAAFAEPSLFDMEALRKSFTKDLPNVTNLFVSIARGEEPDSLKEIFPSLLRSDARPPSTEPVPTGPRKWDLSVHSGENRVREMRFTPAQIREILAEPELTDQHLRQAIEWRLENYGFEALAEEIAKKFIKALNGTDAPSGNTLQIKRGLEKFLPKIFENSVDSYLQKHGIKKFEELDALAAAGEPGITFVFYVFRRDGTAYLHIVDNAFGRIGAETSEEKTALLINGVKRIGGRHTGLLVLDRHFQRMLTSPFYQNIKVNLYDRIADFGDTVRGTVIEVEVDAGAFQSPRSELRAKKKAAPEALDAHAEHVLGVLELASLGGSERQFVYESLMKARDLLKGDDPAKIQKAHSEVKLARQAVPTMGLASVENLVNTIDAFEARLKKLLPPGEKPSPFGRKRGRPSGEARSELRGEETEFFSILEHPAAMDLIARWIDTYPNRKRKGNRTAIQKVLEYLKNEENRKGDFIPEAIRALPFLDRMHAANRKAVQPGSQAPRYKMTQPGEKQKLFGRFVQGENFLNIGTGIDILGERFLNTDNYPVRHSIGVDIERQRDPEKEPYNIPQGKSHRFILMEDPASIPVGDGWANTVAATFMLHHVEVGLEAYLVEIARTMKNGARFIILEDTFSHSIPVQYADENSAAESQIILDGFMRLPSDADRIKLLHFVDWFTHSFVGRSRRVLVPGNYKPLEEWMSLLQKAGFEIEYVQNLGISRLGSLNPVPRGLIVAKKPDGRSELRVSRAAALARLKEAVRRASEAAFRTEREIGQRAGYRNDEQIARDAARNTAGKTARRLEGIIRFVEGQEEALIPQDEEAWERLFYELSDGNIHLDLEAWSYFQNAGGSRSEMRISRGILTIGQAALALAPEESFVPIRFSEDEVAAGIEEYVQARGLDKFSQELLFSVSDLARRLADNFEALGGSDAASALRYRNLQAVLGMMEELARSLAEEARRRHGDTVDNLHTGAPLAVALDEEGGIATSSGINITPESLASALERYKFLLSKVNFVSNGKVAEVLRNIKIPNKRVARGSFISGDEILSLIGEAQIKNGNVWQLDISGDASKLDPFTAELLLNLMILVGGLVNYGSGAAEIKKAAESGDPAAELLKQYPGLAMILNRENLQFAMENGRPTLRFHARILQELLSQEALAVSA